MEKINFQNVIVGWGKGGKTLAKFLATKGESVAVIEQSKKMYGGTCINIACIPSKSLIVNGQRGMRFEDAAAKKSDLVGKLNQKNYHMVADEATATVFDGRARFISDHEIEISAPSADGGVEVLEIVEGGRIFINTGATPVIPPIPGLSESKNMVTSTELMDEKVRPESLVIIGAGYVGLEFAAMFASYGTEVTVLDVGDAFLPREDDDVASRVKADMESQGIVFKLGVSIDKVEDEVTARGDHTFVTVTKNNAIEELIADKVLVATGRRPNIAGLGLENTSVTVGRHGEVVVNDALETTAKSVWAIGDVHGGPQFTYTSLDDFRIIQNHLYGDGTRRLSDRTAVPTSVFITPTLSNVGLNEKAAQAAGVRYRLFKLEASAIVKASVLSQPKGLLKALVNPQTDEILGVTIYAEDSHEVINLLSLAMQQKLPYTAIRDHIFTHPTMSEGLNDLFADANEVKL
jgi:pyruvate/2-oxoglutarate dehydrogenase complex dihydrolipoamide dehydrogenase (E3) component